MRTATKLSVILVCAALVFAFVGCPKKQPPPPPPPPAPEPEPEPEPVPEMYEFNLQTIYFDFDKSVIRPGDGKILTANGNQMLEAAEQDMLPMITLEGHCDPIGTSEYNMALGQRRADAAKAYLVKLGVDKASLTTISYGEERLVTQDAAQYERNRRVEFKPEQ